MADEEDFGNDLYGKWRSWLWNTVGEKLKYLPEEINWLCIADGVSLDQQDGSVNS